MGSLNFGFHFDSANRELWQETGGREKTELSLWISQVPFLGVPRAQLCPLIKGHCSSQCSLSFQVHITTISHCLFRPKALTHLQLLTYPLPTLFKISPSLF